MYDAKIQVVAPLTSRSVFLSDFGAVGFLGATTYESTTNRFVNLTQIANATRTFEGTKITGYQYSADAKWVWGQQGPTTVYLVPQTRGDLVIVNSNYQTNNPILTISDVSDTLAVNNDQATLFLTWVLVGFSVLMLQPILEAVFLREPPSRANPAPPPAKPETTQRAK